MNGMDAVILDGECRVYGREYYETVEVVDGVPITTATFPNKERADEYALECQRRKLHAEMMEKVESVLLCAERFQKDPDNLKGCDFYGALEAIARWNAAEPNDIRVQWCHKKGEVK